MKRANTMSLRSVTTTLFRKLLSDPFWPLTCFSWIYYHWMGSSLFVGIIFSAFAIALHLTLWIFCYCQSILVVANNAQTDVSVVTYYCLMVTHTLTIPSLVTVWMIRGRRRVHRFISTILTVDEKLSELGECPSKKSTSRKLLVLSCYPLVLIGMLALYDINLRKVFQASATGGWDELLLLSNYHNLVIVYIESFFAVSALLVGDRYRAVNSALKKMSREYSYDLENVRWFSYNWINTIRDLRTLHRRLFFAAVMISEALGLQMLIITIVDLITIIGDSYNYYLDNVLPCGSTPAGTTEYLIWCIVHTFPICVLAFCCSWTRDQVIHQANPRVENMVYMVVLNSMLFLICRNVGLFNEI